VSLIDVVEEPKYAYLVMEYCEMDLAKYIKKIKLDENKAKKILKQIICGKLINYFRVSGIGCKRNNS
jgi:serine/threonine protein kinase